jgi:SAM-dependent methyltransferase
VSSYEDLLGTPNDAGHDYFDGEEFALRAGIEQTHYWHVHRRGIILDQLRRFAPPDACGPLVEVGCGIGTVATHLNEHGYRVDYSDVYGEALDIAAKRAREKLGDAATERRFLRMDVTRGLPLKLWSGIMAFDVIEHLPDDHGMLENVRDALAGKEGGFVMVTVPAFQLLWSPWDDVEKHKRRYTREGLTDLLQRTGFEVVQSTYFFGPLFFAALGMKGARLLKSAIASGEKARGIADLTESKNIEALNRVMLGVLSGERAWLERATLPVGTSILAIARCR